MKKISAVIPTYNSIKTLIDAIDSLHNQSYKLHEILVIDNASTDGTSKVIKEKLPGVKLITMSKNTGVTGGRNVGIKNVSKVADIVLFFDHDMVAERDMVKELIKTLESNKNIGIVTPKIYYWENKDVIWSAGTDVSLITGQTLFRGGKDIGQYEKVEEVGVAPAVLLVDKKLIDKKLLFDDIYFATYEDTDFCFKAKKMGFLTYYTPKAIAYHKIPYDNDDANKRLLQRTYYVARNRIIFMKRYSNYFYLIVLLSPIYFLHYVKLSLTYRQIKPVFNYIQGLFAGFVTK